MTNPKCESCGVDFTDHLGLMGTCRELQEQRQLVETLAEALHEMRYCVGYLHPGRHRERAYAAFIRAEELLRKVGK